MNTTCAPIVLYEQPVFWLTSAVSGVMFAISLCLCTGFVLFRDSEYTWCENMRRWYRLQLWRSTRRKRQSEAEEHKDNEEFEDWYAKSTQSIQSIDLPPPTNTAETVASLESVHVA